MTVRVEAPTTTSLRSLGWRAFNRTPLGELCSALTAGRLQIICYHGFSFDDEHRFRGKLFMSPALLEQRLAWLKKHRYVVLALGEAVERLLAGKLGRREIAITIDDGFHSVFALAAPLLHAYRMPATVYVTSYYVTHSSPVFRLAIQYMAWKSPRESVDVSGLVSNPNGSIALHTEATAASLDDFYESVEAASTEDERVAVAREFGARAGVDYDQLALSRRLSLMSSAEIRALPGFGLDVQLHTHRHRLPDDASGIAREIGDNRAALAPLTDGPLEHLCYPSGVWDEAQWPALSSLGIKTATTCIPGFNRKDTHPLALRRFLDGQGITMDEFGAEMLGVKDLYRRMTRRRS
jgi:peptidoglycan/xylan/chitin deacetylase (PgdA/CDA1 family)